MKPLHMISLPVSLAAFNRWAAGRELAVDEGRALHHLLAETFGKGALQPFRLMVSRGGRQGTLYAYAGGDGDTLIQTARETGTPEALAVCDPARLAAKAMPEHWQEGRRFAFDIRARPVRRLMKPLGQFTRKGAELDAFLIEALRRFPDGRPEEAQARLQREPVYLDWLAERLGGAAQIDPGRTHVSRIIRSKAHRANHIGSGPDVTFQGELIVTDATRFAERLARGVGRHAAFGYGMLLLRPSGR